MVDLCDLGQFICEEGDVVIVMDLAPRSNAVEVVSARCQIYGDVKVPSFKRKA